MEIFLLIGLLVLIWWFGNKILSELHERNVEVQQLANEVFRLRKYIEEKVATTDTAAAPPSAQNKEQPTPARSVAPPVAPPPAPAQPAPAHPERERPLKEPAMPAMQEPVAAFTATPAPAARAFAPAPPPAEKPPVPPVPPKPSFFERNPDWEKFIGENLINKIGIAILVLGIGFFVKYAIDQDWINEVGRVAIGIVAGGILLGVAHRLRRDFKAFSSVLVGGGMAVLYFTIAIAFHEYQLFGQTAAFLLMVGITGFTIFLAVAYDRMELGVVALVGGFASPFMVSTGEGNYVVLFTFILILNLGILVLAYFKKWNLLHIIAYVFTVILYSGWLTTRVIDTPDPPYAGALFFATVFYLVFFLMNIINNIKERRSFTAPEIMMLLSNTFLYYAAGMYVLQEIAGGAYKGLFTAAIAAFNFLFAYLLYRNRKADRNLVYLLIGLVLTFLSLVAPVQLEGNYITLFWALEAVLLLWLSQRSGIRLIRVASVAVLALMSISLLMDWQLYFGLQQEPLAVILNKAFITGAVAVVALAVTFFLLRREREPVLIITLQAAAYRIIVGFALVLCLYLVLLLELYYQLDRFGVNYNATAFIIGFYNYLYVAGLLLYSGRLRQPFFRRGAAWLAVAAVVSYLLLLQPAAVVARNAYLTGAGDTSDAFMLHYLPLLVVLLLLALVLYGVRQHTGFESKRGKMMLWFGSFVAVFLASAELEHLALLALYEPETSLVQLLSQVRKIGFAILWGLSSFVLMYLGMSHKIKTLRIISLSLFTLTLLKLFLVDIKGISEGGKIAAFICLGLLLLVVSFMYQKLKILILEDDKELPSDDAPASEQPL